MPEQLPIQVVEGAAFDIFEVTLDDVVLTFTFKWNQRLDSWFVAVADENDEQIIGFTRIVVDWPLFAAYRDIRLPPGVLILVDSEGLAEDPTFETLGTRHVLTYLTEQDLLDTNTEKA